MYYLCDYFLEEYVKVPVFKSRFHIYPLEITSFGDNWKLKS